MPYTNLLFKFIEKNGLDCKTVESVFKEEEFAGYEYKLQSLQDHIYSLTVYSTDDSSYESKRDLVIQKLSKITEYLSITHDSVTKKYIETIGESIYELERKFRTLIEYAFLKKFGSNWAELFNVVGHDRKGNREEVLRKLNNPLDEWDFIHLSRFVNDNITLMDKDYRIKLKSLEQSIATINSKNDIESTKNQILSKVQELLNVSNKKSQNYKFTDFYSHLSSSLASDWDNLYKLRNLWAHNTALMTRKEFESYKGLCESVLNNIHTEITINGIFHNEETKYVELGGNALKIILYKSTSEGRAMVHLKGKLIKSQNDNVSFKKNLVTYIDIINLFTTILIESNYPEIEEVGSFNNNPFLREYLIALGELVSSQVADDAFNKESIERYLHSNGYEVYTDSKEIIMSENVDEYLRIIF